MGTATKATAQELIALEKKFWDAMKAKNGREAARMTDEKCIVVGAQGASTIDRNTMEKMTGDVQWELKDYTLDEHNAQVQMLGDGVALLAYKVNERLVVEGKPVTLEAYDASVWVRRDQDWVCAMHTETIAGDPYGRDRRA